MCLKIVYVSFRQCRCWTNSNRPVFVPGADLGFWTGTTSWLWTNNGTWIAWNVANAKSVWIQSSPALHETEIFIVKKIITGKLIEYSYRFNWGGKIWRTQILILLIVSIQSKIIGLSLWVVLRNIWIELFAQSMGSKKTTQ